MGGLDEENREVEGLEGDNHHQETNPVADEISDTLQLTEQIDDNEATQMLLQLYSTMSKPINLLTQEELSWILKIIQILAKWDEETVADTIDDLKNINSLNLHQSNYLISVLSNIHSFKLNEGQLIHLMGTIYDTHKMSTDESNMKVTPLLSLLMVAEGKPVARWEQKENNNIEVVNKRLVGLHEELKRLITEYIQFISDEEQKTFINFLGEIEWRKDNFLLTKIECDNFMMWLNEENWYTDEKLLEIKETIKTIGGAISSQYKSLKTIVDAINNSSSLHSSETANILEVHDEIIKTERDKDNFELLLKAHKPFLETQEKIYTLKESVVNLLRYILGLIELIEELDRSKVNQPTLIQSATPEGLKNSYGTKSIGELWLNTEVLKNTMQGTHTAFIKLDTLMDQEEGFFKNIFSYIKSPVSQLSEETIVYLTTILSKIYEFDDHEHTEFFNEMCCTKGIDKDQIGQLAEFCTTLRGLPTEEFRNLASNMYQIFHLVKNKAERVKRNETEIHIDPLSISTEGLIALHSKSVSESYEVIKRPLYPKNFHMTLWEVSGYKDKKNNVIETIHGFSDSLLKNNRKIYVQLVNNIACLPENQKISEIVSTTVLREENRKLNQDQAEILSRAIIEYYHFFKNIEAVSMLTQDEVTSVLEIATNSNNKDELKDKLLQKFTVDSQSLNDKDCEFLSEMITIMQQFFEVQLSNDHPTGYHSTNDKSTSMNVLGNGEVSLKKMLTERQYTAKDMKRSVRATSAKKSKNTHAVENLLIAADIHQEEWAMQLALYLFVDKGSNKDPWIANMLFENPSLMEELHTFITKVQLQVVQKTGTKIFPTDSLLL